MRRSAIGCGMTFPSSRLPLRRTTRRRRRRSISAFASASGLPCSRTRSAARSSLRSSIRSARRRRICALSFAIRCFHAGSARCAASIARRVSTAPSRGTSAMTAPVAGSMTGNVAPESALTHAPSTYARSRRRSVARGAMRRTIATEKLRFRRNRRRYDTDGMEPQFVRFDDLAAFALVEGVEGRPLFGESAMVNLIEFGPGATSLPTVIPTSSSASCCGACRRSSSTVWRVSSAPWKATSCRETSSTRLTAAPTARPSSTSSVQ